MYYWAAASPPFHQEVGSNRKNNNDGSSSSCHQSSSSITRGSPQNTPSQTPPPNLLARSSSTSRAVNRRPRLFGHARTASTDSSSATNHQHPLPPPPTSGGTDGDAGSSDKERPAHSTRWHHQLHLSRRAAVPSTPAKAPAATSASAKQSTSTDSDHSLDSSPNWPLPAIKYTPALATETLPSPVRQHVLLDETNSEPASPSASVYAPSPKRHQHYLLELPEPAKSSSSEPVELQDLLLLPAGFSTVPPTYQNKRLPFLPHIQPGAPAVQSASTSSATSEDPGSPVVDVVHSISPSIAALAAASGASIPLAVGSRTKGSFGQRISQHFDRRLNKQKLSTQAPLPGFAQTSSTQSRPRSHEPPSKHHHAVMPHGTTTIHKINSAPFHNTTESVSGTSAATSLSGRTRMSSMEPHSDAEGSQNRRRNPRSQRHFVNRNGRTYIADPSTPYPLPVDLPELNRQSLRTLMMLKLFGRPICSPVFHDRPPVRVLDVGCGTGFWSMKCHQYWAKRGHPNVQFTGVDIVPIAGAGVSINNSGSSGSNNDSSDSLGIYPRPDKDMKWRFVQHDLRKSPWPFPDNEFDLVMLQATTMVTPQSLGLQFMDEVMRVLCPGGVAEFWESDHIVRMLRPHVPTAMPGRQSADGDSGDSDEDSGSDEGSDDSSADEDPDRTAASLGAYVMTANTPMSSPLNNYLVEYNSWVTKALDARSLSPVPCTLINPILLQEEGLMAIGSKRLAVPLSEVKWEREGVGGVVTKDGKSYVKGLKGENGGADTSSVSSGGKGKALSASQTALRKTALLTVVQLIQSLEPLLREVSGKSQDEWDGWLGKMMNDLLKENGTSWGECLELGAWWARKRK